MLVAIEAGNRGQTTFGLVWAGIMGLVGPGFLNAGLRSALPPKGRG